jgi:hypothetical protein
LYLYIAHSTRRDVSGQCMKSLLLYASAGLCSNSHGDVGLRYQTV